MAPPSNDTDLNASCKKCKSKVVNSIKCQQCGQLYQKSCAKLCGKFFDEGNTFICCEPNEVNVSTPDIDFWDALEDLSQQPVGGLNIRILAYIIKQKDLIIEEQKQQIHLLKNQIAILSPSTATSKIIADNTKTTISKKFSSNDRLNQGQQTDKIPKKQTTNNHNTDANEAVPSTSTVQTEPNTEPNTEAREQSKWKSVTSKKNRQRSKPVVGCSSTQCSLQAVPRRAYI